MQLIIVAELLFVSLCFAIFGAAVSLVMRSRKNAVEAKLKRREIALRDFRARYYEIKEKFVNLQGEYVQLQEQCEQLESRSDFAGSILAEISIDSELPAAKSARTVLQIMALGLSENLSPAKTARNVISALSSLEIPVAGRSGVKETATALIR